MSNRLRRDAALVETHVGAEGVFADDLDGMLGHIGRDHIYAERAVDVTPAAVLAKFNERVWKDGTGAWDGVNAANVLLGRVEPGTFWLVEALNVYGALAADVGFAYVMEGVGTTTFARRARVTMDAGGAYVNFGAAPVFVGGGDVFVRCVQTTPAASSVIVTAQVRIVAKN